MRIFVGNLPFSVTDEDLAQAFQAYGEVAKAEVVMNKFTHRSRGFGFVDMPNQEEALQAIKSLNQTSFNGRNISVSEARPLKERG